MVDWKRQEAGQWPGQPLLRSYLILNHPPLLAILRPWNRWEALYTWCTGQFHLWWSFQDSFDINTTCPDYLLQLCIKCAKLHLKMLPVTWEFSADLPMLNGSPLHHQGLREEPDINSLHTHLLTFGMGFNFFFLHEVCNIIVWSSVSS